MHNTSGLALRLTFIGWRRAFLLGQTKQKTFSQIG
jgi:hypothetical protein